MLHILGCKLLLGNSRKQFKETVRVNGLGTPGRAVRLLSAPVS